ncbi:aryl-alcohol dehydrogenase-like predicted oxidoreductase [Flavobacterium gossypii]|uniref:Aryl-alcohol dehydrogenase-like predicted oxidoreductase n=1 Tax=Flavobacterium gossypii TaxID=1646119 RepID=A0ABR6DP93_9FLAO|nr:aldo/keto reductase [Flavobacterium gossypii]MBA9073516.1 aryl-alcohol dehydrogenase-like predicted oxidoreductase [Flavobacterium gossypii]
MKKQQLGNTDLYIYPIAFGGNVFGWTLDEKKSFEILNGFTEAGFNFIDTADVYSRWAPGNTGGESERIIGKWLKEKKNRHDIVLTTKVGSDMGDGKKGLKKAYILKAIEDSLQRLNTDYLDLYQTHFDDVETPVEETLEAYAQLEKDGKIRWIGTSNMTPERIKASLEASAAKGLPRYQTLQPHYNLYAREKYETNYEALALENNLGVITYFSLESGFLTGKYRTKADLAKSPRGGDMDKYFDERGLKILAALDEVSKHHKATPAAVALAWLLHKPSVTAPIVSATSTSQLESIILAPNLRLDAEAMQLLDDASSW